MRHLLALTVVILASAGCSGGGSEASPPPSGPDPAAVARMLVASFPPSTDARYQDVRCAHAVGLTDGNYACTLEVIGLRRQSDEFAVTTTTVRHGRIVSSGGFANVDQTCFQSPDCWAQELATATCDTCSAAAPYVGPLAPVRDPVALPPTVDECIEGWNIHGGFAPEETADSQQVTLPSQPANKPVYTPYLAPASMGYLSARVAVEVVQAGCAVDVEVGRHAYRISTDGGLDPWTWVWQGAEGLSPAPSSWNACQNADGTVAAANCTSTPGIRPRDVVDELRRRTLGQMASVGGFPYWLGMPFRGAMPVATPQGELLLVQYAVQDHGRPVGIAIYTGLSEPIPADLTPGHLVLRAHPDAGSVVVTTTWPISASLRKAITRSLRPFQATDPDQHQKPGDLVPTQTRVDARAPRRPLGFGQVVHGLRAAVESDVPPGVGVVRYGPPGGPRTFYVVTYRPILGQCGALGCVSPPPLPAELRRYGRETRQTWIMSDWVTTILAAHPSSVPTVTPTTTPRPVR